MVLWYSLGLLLFLHIWEVHSDQPNITDLNCAYKSDLPQPRIAGGNIVHPPGKYPYMVSLFGIIREETIMAAFKCGGTLIGGKYVLTAAHCVLWDASYLADFDHFTAYKGRYQELFLMNKENLAVVAGDHDLCTSEKNMECTSFIEKIYIHPDYQYVGSAEKKNYAIADIAILKTTNNLFCNQHVRSVCLPKSPIESNLPLTAMGWGLTNLNRSLITIRDNSFKLKEVSKVSLTADECRSYAAHFQENMMVCAGPKARNNRYEGVLSGDSGGPLIYQQKKWT